MAHNDRVVRLIGALKLVKGVVLIGLAVGAFELVHPDVAERVRQWGMQGGTHAIHHLVLATIGKVNDLGSHKLLMTSLALLVYAGLFLTEGTALLLRKRWGEYLTVFITGSFIPFEIYEMVHKQSVMKGAVLVLNIAIVIYLVWHLRATRKHAGEAGHAHHAFAH